MDFKLLALGLILFFCSSLASADINERYHLSMGQTLLFFNSKFGINSRDNSIDSTIDLENDLNYDRQVDAAWISGWYRTGDNHRLKITYIPVRRSSFLQNTRDIEIDNTLIKSGAFMTSNTRSDIVDFSYIYSLHKADQIEVGFSAGIYWLLNTTKVIVAGEIIPADSNQPVFKADYFTQQKLQAPMPLFGLDVNYELNANWRTRASFRYLAVQINEIDGEILSTELATEYYFNNNWGIGASVSAFNLNVNVEGIISTTSLTWAYDGIQLYAVYKY